MLVQPFSAVHSRFCSMISNFPPFVHALFGEFEFSTVHSKFHSVNSRFLPFVWVLIGSVRFSTVRSSFRSVFLEFLAVRAVFNRLFGVSFRSIAFLVSESGVAGATVVLWWSCKFLRRFGRPNIPACCCSCVRRNSREFGSF